MIRLTWIPHREREAHARPHKHKFTTQAIIRFTPPDGRATTVHAHAELPAGHDQEGGTLKYAPTRELSATAVQIGPARVARLAAAAASAQWCSQERHTRRAADRYHFVHRHGAVDPGGPRPDPGRLTPLRGVGQHRGRRAGHSGQRQSEAEPEDDHRKAASRTRGRPDRRAYLSAGAVGEQHLSRHSAPCGLAPRSTWAGSATGSSRITRSTTWCRRQAFPPRARLQRVRRGEPHLPQRSVTDGDYGLDTMVFNISETKPFVSVNVVLWSAPADPSHDDDRGACGVVGGGDGCHTGEPVRAFLTLPTSCGAPPTTTLLADSWLSPGQFTQRGFQVLDEFEDPVSGTGCDRLSFDPTVAVQPTTTAP